MGRVSLRINCMTHCQCGLTQSALFWKQCKTSCSSTMSKKALMPSAATTAYTENRHVYCRSLIPSYALGESTHLGYDVGSRHEAAEQTKSFLAEADVQTCIASHHDDVGDVSCFSNKSSAGLVPTDGSLRKSTDNVALHLHSKGAFSAASSVTLCLGKRHTPTRRQA